MPLDYKNTEDGDLLFENGDLVIHDSTLQHQEDILVASKGDYREFPDIGVDIQNWLEDDNSGDLPNAIRQEFEKDGMIIKRLQVLEDGTSDIQASYE